MAQVLGVDPLLLSRTGDISTLSGLFLEATVSNPEQDTHTYTQSAVLYVHAVGKLAIISIISRD